MTIAKAKDHPLRRELREGDSAAILAFIGRATEESEVADVLEAVKGHYSDPDDRIADIEAEIAMLQREMDELESRSGVTTTDLENACLRRMEWLRQDNAARALCFQRADEYRKASA